IFLSPHFDDVVYSCGGTLGVQVSCGLRPLVITVFGGIPSANLTLSPFAMRVHQEMGADFTKAPGNAVEIRRKEDANALDYLEVDYLWLDYLDALYRGSPAYYSDRKQLIGGDVHPADAAIDRQLASELLALQERLPDTAWYTPLGVGRHVDHQIVCSAADRLTQRGAKVYYYEDFPYILQEGALEARKQELGLAFEPNLVEMSEMLPIRVAAAEMYSSQVAANFGSNEALQRTTTNYTYSIRPVETVHLERYWTVG
ncbi:MAG: PIG-L family deacetylase, partial [Ktedonobacteraceae bacterium]|nr:PIG-L family deacetylase [Ktedonobacteraceae bacterium]